MSPDDEKLILAAADLSRAAAPYWTTFLKELALRRSSLAMKCVRATPDMLVRTQGMANEAVNFYDMMENCRENADNIRAERKAQAQSQI